MANYVCKKFSPTT